MLKFVVGILIDKIIEAVLAAVSDYRALQKKKKQDASEVKEALNEKDPIARARRMRDLLK